MALFKLPLSGDVVQWINPVTWFLSGNQITANVYLGESGSPEVEAEILDRVGTYGRQLGKITDAVIVLLRHLPIAQILRRKNVGDRGIREDGQRHREHKREAQASGGAVMNELCIS